MMISKSIFIYLFFTCGIFITSQAQSYKKLIVKAEEAFLSKEYILSSHYYEKAFELNSYEVTSNDCYNAACVFSLSNNLTKALKYLEECLRRGNKLITASHIKNDTDLNPLRDNSEFARIIRKYFDQSESAYILNKEQNARKEQNPRIEKVNTFRNDLGRYFNNYKTDVVEGLYTISDVYIFSYPWWYLTSDQTKNFDHWAKVAIIRDSTSLTQNYYELIVESSGFSERDWRASFLRTKQSPNIFISKQLSEDKKGLVTVMFEYVPDEDRFVGKFEGANGNVSFKCTRTYLKYYPKK